MPTPPPTLTLEDLVFVDKSGIAADMAWAYGHAPDGQRATDTVPFGP